MGTTTLNNGVRKSLASQLDLLDAILDGLADNLNEAVAMAVATSMKEIVTVAVQEAVHAALVEIHSNAELQKRMLASQTVTTPMLASLMARLAAKVRSYWNWLADTAKDTLAKVVAATIATLMTFGAAAGAVAPLAAWSALAAGSGATASVSTPGVADTSLPLISAITEPPES